MVKYFFPPARYRMAFRHAETEFSACICFGLVPPALITCPLPHLCRGTGPDCQGAKRPGTCLRAGPEGSGFFFSSETEVDHLHHCT